VRVYSCS